MIKNNYISVLKKEVRKFKNSERKTVEDFLKQFSITDKVNKSVNIDKHIVVFFIPINKKSKSIYLVYHIKADDWIPPGGHIELFEHPTDTVVREFREELNYKITKKQISVFDLSIKDISNNPRNPCRLHFDFWYLVDTPKKDFKYLEKEFKSAGWYTIKEALKKIKTPLYNHIVRKLKKLL